MSTEIESTKAEIEDEFDRSNQRAILSVVQDTLLDYAALLNITPGEIMQEIRSRLEMPK